MTSLEGFTLFTSGIRFAVLGVLIIVLWNSIKATVNQDSLYSRIAHNPRMLLGLIITLLFTSLIQISVEFYDHWGNTP